MTFVKHQGIDPRIDYWVDVDRDALTVVVNASDVEVAIMFYSDPDTVPKEQILKEMQDLYADRPVSFSKDTDKYQAALRKMGYGVIPHEERVRQKEIILVGAANYNLYANHFLTGGEPTQFRTVLKVRPLEPRRPPPVSPTGVNRQGKPAKHWQR